MMQPGWKPRAKTSLKPNDELRKLYRERIGAAAVAVWAGGASRIMLARSGPWTTEHACAGGQSRAVSRWNGSTSQAS